MVRILAYLVKRVLLVIPAMLLLAIVSYAIVALFPGDFYTAYKLRFALQATGDNWREQVFGQYEALLAARGLDKPWYTQLYYWLEGIIRHGSLGYSFASGVPVTRVIFARWNPLWWTLMLVGTSIFIGWIVGVPLGVFGAAFYGKRLETLVYSIIYVLGATPVAILGYGFMALNNKLRPNHWILPKAWGTVHYNLAHSPLTWEKALSHLTRISLAWLMIATPVVIVVSRHLRGSLVEVMNRQYITTARSKGLSRWRLLFGHALRNALNPLVSMSGFMLTDVIGNSILATHILYQPNLGMWIVKTAERQDQPMLTAYFLLLGTLLIIGTLISDLCLAMLDPRIRYD